MERGRVKVKVKVKVGEGPMAAEHLGMAREMGRPVQVRVGMEMGCQVLWRTCQSWGCCRGE
jgi:hypothetical protein